MTDTAFEAPKNDGFNLVLTHFEDGRELHAIKALRDVGAIPGLKECKDKLDLVKTGVEVPLTVANQEDVDYLRRAGWELRVIGEEERMVLTRVHVAAKFADELAAFVAERGGTIIN